MVHICILVFNLHLTGTGMHFAPGNLNQSSMAKFTTLTTVRGNLTNSNITCGTSYRKITIHSHRLGQKAICLVQFKYFPDTSISNVNILHTNMSHQQYTIERRAISWLSQWLMVARGNSEVVLLCVCFSPYTMIHSVLYFQTGIVLHHQSSSWFIERQTSMFAMRRAITTNTEMV